MTELPGNLWSLFFSQATGSASPRVESEADWQRVATAASEEGLLPLLMHQPPPELIDAVRRASALRALVDQRYRLQAAAARTFALIYGDGVFYKGWDLRHRLYSSPELRPSADLDVLVRPADVRALRTALTAAGHPQVISATGTVWAPFHYELGFDIGEVRVEVHRSALQPVRVTIDYEEIHSARESFVVDGVTFYRPSPLHALVLQALSLAKDELAAPLVRFVDLWLMLRAWPGEIDPAIELAHRWSVRRALYASCRLVGLLFDDTPDLYRVEQLVSGRERKFLDSRVIPDRTMKQAGHHEGRIAQLWRKFWLMDNAWRRISFTGFHVATVVAGGIRQVLNPGVVERYRQRKGTARLNPK